MAHIFGGGGGGGVIAYQIFNFSDAYSVELVLCNDGGHCHVAEQGADIPGRLLTSVLKHQYHSLVD